MASMLVISMTLWWIVAVPILSAAIWVLAFLARHPVDGEARLIEWAERNSAPGAIGGVVAVYLLFPSVGMLAFLLVVFWAVARFGAWQPDMAQRTHDR